VREAFGSRDAELLASCYRNALALAVRHGLQEVGGKPEGLEGLHNGLPTPKIGNQLGADLLTGNAVVQSGEMDVGLLCIAIPACHYVVKEAIEQIKQHKRLVVIEDRPAV
jgi:hypothetical protein